MNAHPPLTDEQINLRQLFHALRGTARSCRETSALARTCDDEHSAQLLELVASSCDHEAAAIDLRQRATRGTESASIANRKSQMASAGGAS